MKIDKDKYDFCRLDFFGIDFKCKWETFRDHKNKVLRFNKK